MLSDTHPAIRGMAAWLLGILDDKPASAAILQLLQDQDWMVRKAAASALGRLEDNVAFDELPARTQTDRAEVQRSAVWGSPNSLPSNNSLLAGYRS